MKKNTIHNENTITTKKYTIIYFILIGIIFLFTRLYKIMSIPNGLHIDEISIGYNAWSLSQFGTDRYNISFPVYFNNAGSGQSSLYIYITALLSKIFGYNIVMLRLPAVIFGIILLVFLTLTAYEMFGTNSAYITAGIITIMPVFIMGERFAFDCYAFLPMFAMLLYFSVKLIKTEKPIYAILSGISISLCLYSYILAFIIIPVFVIIGIIYCSIYKKISITNTIIAAVTSIILSIPIISYIFVVFGIIEPFTIGKISITDASFQRTSEFHWQHKSIITLLKNLFEVTDHDNYNFVADEKFGVFYSNRLFGLSLSQILILISFIAIIGFCIYKNKQKDFNYETIILIAAFCTLLPLLFTEGFAIYRYESFLLMCTLALSYVFNIAIEHNYKVLSAIIGIIFLFNFGSYCFYIFGNDYDNINNRITYFDSELLDVCSSIDISKYQDYQIYVDDVSTYNTGLIVLYGLKVPPAIIASDEIKNMDISNMSYNNIHIGIPDYVKDEKSIYIIKDINKGSSLYTDVENPISVYEKLVNDNKIKKSLIQKNAKEELYNDYYIYYLD